MAAVAEQIREDTDRQVETPSRIGPVGEAALRDLVQAIDERTVSTLRDVLSLIGATNVGYDSAPEAETMNRRYDFTFTDGDELTDFGSVTLEGKVLERLRHRLVEDDNLTAESLIESVFDDAYQEAKEQEAGRMVPFGIRLSSYPTGGSRATEHALLIPNGATATWCRIGRRRRIPIIDDLRNDDRPPY